MKIIPDDAFLAWAAEAGLVPDPCGSGCDRLVFSGVAEASRLWFPAGVASDIPGFIATALELASVSGRFRLRHRGGGPIFYGEDASFRERLIEFALHGIEVPADAHGAMEFEQQEWAAIVHLATVYYTSGWCVETDLEIVPVERDCCLMLSHHGALSGLFASGWRCARFESGMAAAGYMPSKTGEDA